MNMLLKILDKFDIMNDINNNDVNNEYSFISFGVESSNAKHLLKLSFYIS